MSEPSKLKYFNDSDHGFVMIMEDESQNNENSASCSNKIMQKSPSHCILIICCICFIYH